MIDKRNFGIADDVYAAGLLLAYMTFIPFCEPGSIDAPSLQRYACLTPFFQLSSRIAPKVVRSGVKFKRALKQHGLAVTAV